MSYLAHRSHRGTYRKKLKVGTREVTATCCGFCDLTDFDSRIRKPCFPKAPPPNSSLPEVTQ